jgi:hypothetical protein
MNSLWSATTDEIANVLHNAAAHPFGAFCWIAAGLIVTTGAGSIIKEKIDDHRDYLESKAKADAIPNPPLMNLTSRADNPRIPR